MITVSISFTSLIDHWFVSNKPQTLITFVKIRFLGRNFQIEKVEIWLFSANSTQIHRRMGLLDTYYYAASNFQPDINQSGAVILYIIKS